MIVTIDPHRLREAIASVGGSKTSIARQSGVSRAQLGRLVAGDEARVRQSTLTHLARALGVGPQTLLIGGAIACYKRWLAEETGYIDFRGFGMPSVQRQPIQEVFVDLAVEEDAGECQKDCSPRESRSRNLRRPSDRTAPATRCVLDHDRVVVLGNPGSGKTTLLRYLAYSTAATTTEPAEIPIYVRLPELCRGQKLDEHFDLVNFLAVRSGERGCPDVEVLLRQELASENRRCLVLLDGLDEVGNQEQREWLIRGVQAFIEQYPRNRYAITSRPMGFDAAPWRSQGFSVFRVREYDKTRLERFAEKWAAVLSRTDNKPYSEVRERLDRAIFDSPRVQALACNPLILTILVLLNEARGGALPRRRVDLYEKVVDVFLDTWESTKQFADKFDDTRGIDLDAREFRWLLSDLSLAMQKAERTLAPRWWIAEKIEDYLQHKLGFVLDEAKDACDRVIRYLAQRTGLIEERGSGLCGFSQRTLQEYFASRGVIDEADAAPERGVIGCLRGYYFHPQWSEVVRLVAAQLAPPLAESLLASVLDDPDPVGRFLRRGPLLVLRCLADGTSIANRRFISGIFDSLAELGKSRWLGITLEVMEAFSDLQGTRWEEPANLARETILESAAGGLDAEEYRCLHCACALEGQIANDPVLAATLKSWLQSPDVPGLARVGAQLLARAMAHEKLDWDHEVIEKAESLLMSVEDPCPCALDSLRAIATAREVRHGLRLESVLRDSLRPLADSIELAFVFGSTARNRQVPDSDIDLFILGSATLKSLSGPLRQAEKVLGRRVNPAIYTRDSFRERYQRGDPFLLDVYRREKLPVIRKSGENLQTELEDELRAMVAERVASTA